VIANGGIYCADDALRLLDRTGCDGVAIGQGAMGNPFIFSECIAALENKPFIAPTTDEILKTAHEHIDMLCADKGGYIGVRESRKHLGWYIKGMPGAADARRSINAAESADELHSILNSLL
jgi:tRNA-dihydrouridine synthase B